MNFEQIVKEMIDLHESKNHDYGNSFHSQLDEDGLIVAKVKLKDKINRFSTLIKHDQMVKDESIMDTLLDLANYSVMTIEWIKQQNHDKQF